MRKIRFSLHNHSDASPDSKSTIEDMLKECERKRIDFIAITDHNILFDMKRVEHLRTRVKVIPGIEVSTRDDSHVIGLFVDKEIPGLKLTAIQIIRLIHEQGGIAVLVHPYRDWQGTLSDRYGLGEKEKREVIDEADLIEVFNGKSTPNENRKAEELCKRLGKPFSCGSDAHTVNEIRNAVLEIEWDRDDPKQALLKGKRRAVIDTSFKAIYYGGHSLRSTGTKMSSALGIRKGSAPYRLARSALLGLERNARRALRRK